MASFLFFKALMVLRFVCRPCVHAQEGHLEVDFELLEENVFVDEQRVAFRVVLPAGMHIQGADGSWTPEARHRIITDAEKFCRSHQLEADCSSQLSEMVMHKKTYFLRDPVQTGLGKTSKQEMRQGEDCLQDSEKRTAAATVHDVTAQILHIFLNEGLLPHHFVAEMGCGHPSSFSSSMQLWGGARELIQYIAPAHYFGVSDLVDENGIENWYASEIVSEVLTYKLPRTNLVQTATLNLVSFGIIFDFIFIQVSCLDTLTVKMAVCLEQAAKVLRPGGIVLTVACLVPGLLIDLYEVAARHGFEFIHTGAWGHEAESAGYRSATQVLLKFIRRAVPATMSGVLPRSILHTKYVTDEKAALEGNNAISFEENIQLSDALSSIPGVPSDMASLRVDHSSVPGAGRGIFATEDLLAGALLCEMRGTYVQDMNSIPPLLKDRLTTSRHGILVENGICSLINDCRKPPTKACWPGLNYNAKLVSEDASGKLFVQAIVSIKKGDELFYDYETQDCYWQDGGC